ncbi:MMPL family transporter [Pandoraea apista]|uniref:hopanoid transporter HpnN n=1 Tax=Pandoraea apista TaxID=93218 RepID=UPI00058ABC55|nr:MMPL family transporter [Pandoraea apista]AJE96987.1 RND transporter [Pandoraea apista]AKH70933.1 RND transporter [Pandoraea apista]AKI61817.1 RND transporter [Pandoraea apista]
MLTSLVVRIVRFSAKHAYPVIFASLLLVIASSVYVAKHFAINTDISSLIDSNTPAAERGREIDRAFPQKADITLAVVQAPAVEFADRAAAELAEKLSTETDVFRSVSRPGSGEFFARNALLFASLDDVKSLTGKLEDAKPLLNRLAQDPSLTGLSNLLSVTLQTPLLTGQVKLPDMARLLGNAADTTEAVLAGRPAGMSWRSLVAPDTVARSYVQVQPVLDYAALEAGANAATRIRDAAADLKLAERYGATVRLTGPRPLSDEEFASVREDAGPNAIITMLAVLVVLWLAVRSGKMILAVFITLLVGLVVTFALGLMMVGALNMISVAFAVLFVGIGVDFGIQFGVRYREERHRLDSDGKSSSDDVLRGALAGAGKAIAMPLSLAAAATAASFFSFLPTDYRGVSELGLIAGVGILCVAFPSAITLLPALISVFKPKGEASPPGFRSLGPVDDFTDKYRKPLLYGTLALVVAGLPLLAHLHFDFNPLHLKDPKTESMATLLDLANSPEAGVNDVQLLAPTLDAANAEAAKLRAVPEVGRVVTLTTFIPTEQPAKLAQIGTAAASLLPVLTQTPLPPVADAARVSSLKTAAGQLEDAALDHPGEGAKEAQRLAIALRKLAAADAATRERADRAIAGPLKLALGQLRDALQPREVTRESLPRDIVSQWVAADGRALVNISPHVEKGADPSDDAMLRKFSAAVLASAPDAVGGPISILRSADTIIRAFIEAGIWALLSITVLLWLALRNFGDVLRTLVPLLVSAAVTLEITVLIGLPLNFANIIALPLLLGVGVAFKIYYVIAWREGKTQLLASSLTQAIVLSAATTGIAFGSLWLSHHPGTSSMGKLLALSLVCTLIGAVFFQPVLMGKPREKDVPQKP